MFRYSNKKVLLSALVLFLGFLTTSLKSQVLINEGFTTVDPLPTDWAKQNLSTPVGTTNWFQGDAAVFTANSGATNSYVAANFRNVTTVGISNWLFTPTVAIKNGCVFSFYTRAFPSATVSKYPDRLQLRMSTNGGSVNAGTTNASVGDFTTLLVDINPTVITTGYPFVWTKYTVTITGVPNLTTGRFAFRYFLENGGPSGTQSEYIGIDDVQYIGSTAGAASSTPTLCINTALTNIMHTTTLATGISNDNVAGANGLPAGVKAQWAANQITISGTPTASGIFNYSIPLTGGIGSINATGTITVTAAPTAAAAGADQTGASTCGSISVTLAGNTPSVGTGAWSIVSGTGGSVTTPSSPTSTFTGTAGSSYTLRWTISNSPCTASTDDVVIKFNLNPGNFGNALSFDGSNDNVSIPNAAGRNNFASSNKFTIECWVKVFSDVVTSGVFINKGGGGGLEQYSLDISGSLRFYVNTNTGFGVLTTARPTVAEGWVHLAGIYDGAIGSLRLYKNGILVASSTSAGSTLISNTNPLSFGTQANSTSSPLSGAMDEVRIWNTVRTEAQIQSSMNSELAGTEIDLVAYYNFNQAAAGGTNTGLTTLNDGTSSGNNGTLTNFALTGSTSNWVTGNSFSIASITGTSTICSNGTTQMADATLGGVWSFPNSTYATVNSTGLVSGVAGGSPTLSYTLTSGSGCTSVATQVITVRSAFTSGAILTTGQTICSGGTPSVIGSSTASSGGDGTITYFWKSSADSYGSAIVGAASATYTPPAGLTTTTSYQRYAKDGTCNTTPTVSTGTWTVTVRSVFTSGAILTTGQTICSGGTPSVIGSSTASSGGDGTITYSWRSSADNYGSPILGAASDTYTPPAGLTITTSYQRYAKDGTCSITSTLSTGTWTVTVSATPTASAAGADQNVVSSGGILSATLAGNAPTVGTGLWSIVSGSGGTITDPTNPLSTFTGSASSSYTLRWTITNALCTSSDDMLLTSGFVWTGLAGDNLWNTAGNWSTGTLPLATTDIVINSGTPRLNIDFEVGGSLNISGTGTLTVNAGKTLSIASTGTADFGGKLVTFKSDATGSAQFGQMLGTLSNASNVTVERHIPASNRTFRLISSPVTTTSSIKYNWMENATLSLVSGYPYAGGSLQNPNAGYGTHITGATGNAAGFDETYSNSNSLFTHDNTNAAWNAVTTTAGTLAAGDAYRIQIRGDRGYAIFASPLPVQSATTLRTNGTLYTGTKMVSLNTTANGFSMIGNPYQATVDMYAAGITKTNITSYYYIWDPRMATRGAYVAYSNTTGSNNIASAMNQYLQPGQAVFVQTAAAGAASITFGESAKSIASNQSLVFSRFKGNAGVEFSAEPNTPQATYTSLSTTLYYTDSLATGAMPMDGMKVMFDNTFSNVVDQVDARKMYNLDETMSVLRDGTNLSIELMNRPDSTTVIPLNITQYRTQKYTMRMNWTNPYVGVNNKVTAYLKDKYTGSQYEINNILATDIPYTIDAAVPTSFAADRFDIIFKTTALVVLPIAEIALTAAVQQNGIKLQWTNPYDKDLSKYEVERSADGRVFTKVNTQAAGNGIQKNIIYNWFDATPIEGYNYYRIKGLALNNGKTQWSNNLKIRSWTVNIGTAIVPNPAERTGLNVKTDLPKGYYDMKLIDTRGRVVYIKGVEYNGLGGAIELRYGVQLAAGTYYLHIEGMGERVVRTAVVQ